MPAVPVVCKGKSDGSGMSVAPVKGPKARKTRKRSKAVEMVEIWKADQNENKMYRRTVNIFWAFYVEC